MTSMYNNICALEVEYKIHIITDKNLGINMKNNLRMTGYDPLVTFWT